MGSRPIRLGLLIFAAAPAIIFPPAPRAAEDWQFGGHVKYQFTSTDYRRDDLNAVFGDDPARDHSLDLRFKAERRSGGWDAVIHYELLAVGGDSIETNARIAASGLPLARLGESLPDDRRRLFDLTQTVSDRSRREAVHRLDRLSVGHSDDRQVLRAGRQVVSWGNGLVFHVLDFVNPFSPIAIDKDYKTGDDMLYGQWLLVRGGDVQAIVLPRRDAVTRDIESEEGTIAFKYRARFGANDLDLLAARHFDDSLFGAGVVRSIGGAVWRLDLLYSAPNGADDVVSAVTNVDYSWVWGGKNFYGYIEYFRNGFGEHERRDYPSPDPALLVRIDRGELFTLARDSMALGLQIELTPLFNLYNNLIVNLHDRSRFYQLRGVYDWKQNLQLMAGLNLPGGERGDEYGGIAVPMTTAFAAPGRAAYVRLAYFF